MSVKKWQREVRVGTMVKGPDFQTTNIVRGTVIEANDRFVFIRRADNGLRASIRREDLQRPVN